MLQGQRDLVTVGRMLLSELAPLVDAQQGTIYQMERSDPGETVERVGEDAAPPRGLRAARRSARAHRARRRPRRAGRGREAAHPARTTCPPDYTPIHSSLGAAPPTSVIVLPVLFEGETMAVIELAALRPFTNTHLQFLDQLTQSIGVVLNTIEATMRTENLLQQSQQLTTELQTRQIELQQTNEELASKAKQLAEQNAEVERKNKEVEQARRALEEKAAELALTSKYKSEFLANMSHELRTPLNSILILGQQLAENVGGNLTVKQIDFAKNIHSAGTDLLTLINDILDLSKIESGTVTVEPEEITFANLRDTVHRTFHHVAETKGLGFNVDIDPTLPRALVSDPKRLQQILKNLLSNAFKFTAQGRVAMSVAPGDLGLERRPPGPRLRRVRRSRSPSTDTGIGIAPEKQKLIFEAFQQADAGTSRKYGGTGLGLAISRELANLLGGEIRLAEQARARAARSRSTCRSRTRGRRSVSSPARAASPIARAERRAGALGREDRGGRPRRSRRHPRGRHGRSSSSRTTRTTRASCSASRAIKGFKAHRREPRPAGALARARVPAGRDQPRRVPAGHARLDGAQQPQARPAHASHPGADAVRRGGAPARPVARRVRVSRQAGDDRRARERVRQAQDVRRAAHEAPPRHRGQQHASARASSSSSATTTSRSPPSAPGARRSRRCASGATTAASSTCGCRT